MIKRDATAAATQSSVNDHAMSSVAICPMHSQSAMHPPFYSHTAVSVTITACQTTVACSVWPLSVSAQQA